MKLDPADITFSHYIRLRDMECKRCHSPVTLNEKGLPNSHTNSHYFGRGRENTRYDERNCICLCMACHRIWASDDREEYRNFMISWLGQSGYDDLCIRSRTYCKKDRTLSLIIAKQLLKELKEKTE